MRIACVILLLLGWGIPSRVGFPQEATETVEEPTTKAEPESTTLESETVEAIEPAPADQTATPVPEGAMESAQVKELLHAVWLAEFRINDLLTEVKPERWKMAEGTRASFEETLGELRRQLESLEAWRDRFDSRPDSAYLAYETYAAISAVLPRLDGVARSIAQHENPSFGVQFSQAGNKLFDLQQTVGSHVGLLLRNQDQALYALQVNLAACHNELGYALRGKTQHATPMKNIPPDFKGRRVRERDAEEAEKAKTSAPANSLKPRKLH